MYFVTCKDKTRSDLLHYIYYFHRPFQRVLLAKQLLSFCEVFSVDVSYLYYQLVDFKTSRHLECNQKSFWS